MKNAKAKTIFSDFLGAVDANSQNIAAAAGTFTAAMNRSSNCVLDPRMVTRFTSAASNYGVSFKDMIEKLPGELKYHGTDAVNNFLKNGDPRGKEWSHIKSQYNSPDLASDARNAIWEDGTVNNYRNSADMNWGERAYASIDNHWDGFVASVESSEFWDQAVDKSSKAGVYTMAYMLLEKLLTHRDKLINGTSEEKEILYKTIAIECGLAGVSAFQMAIVFQILLCLIPGLASILAPLAIISMPLLGYKLGKVIAENPSRQEKDLIESLNYQLEQLKQNIEFTPIFCN